MSVHLHVAHSFEWEFVDYATYVKWALGRPTQSYTRHNWQLPVWAAAARDSVILLFRYSLTWMKLENSLTERAHTTAGCCVAARKKVCLWIRVEYLISDTISSECVDVIERFSEDTGMLPCWAIHLKIPKGRIFGISLQAFLSSTRQSSSFTLCFYSVLCVGFNDKNAWLLRWRLCSPAPVTWQQSMDESHPWRSNFVWQIVVWLTRDDNKLICKQRRQPTTMNSSARVQFVSIKRQTKRCSASPVTRY